MGRPKKSVAPKQTPLEESLFSIVKDLSRSVAVLTETLSKVGRPSYKPVEPVRAPKLTDDQLLAAAMMVPDFNDIKIVDDVKDLPAVSHKKVMLREEAQRLVGGANGAFQGRYRAQDPAAKLNAEAARRNRSGSGQGDGPNPGVVPEAQPSA